MLQKVNLRVHVVDVDVFSANDILMDFNCVFDVDPRDIARDAQSANWGPSTECQATGQNGKIKYVINVELFFVHQTSTVAPQYHQNYIVEVCIVILFKTSSVLYWFIGNDIRFTFP